MKPMGKNRFLAALRHPVFAFAGAVLFALAAFVFVRGGIATGDRLAVADDPVAISDRALDSKFSAEVADRKIRAALSAGDVGRSVTSRGKSCAGRGW